MEARVCGQDVICVLGMHRSGTSLLTRILNIVGVHLGSEAGLLQPGPDNPKGYWEHFEVCSINEAILNRHGGSWDEPPMLPPGWETAAALDDLRHRAEQFINDHFAEVQLWGWKDPRSCLTLPFWQQLLPEMRYVICLRNPVDVALSLEDRNSFSAEKSSSLWLSYVSSALNHTDGKPRLMIFYEDVMADFGRELQRLATFLGKPERAQQVDVQEAVEEFIEMGLQHYRASIVHSTASSRIDLRAKALYLAKRISVSFGRKEINGRQESDNQIYKALDVLSQYSSQASGQANPLLERLAALEAQSDDNRRTIRSLQMSMVKQGKELETVAVGLTESEQAVKTLSAKLIEKDEIIQARSTELAEQTRAWQGQAESVEARSRVLSAQLLHNETELQKIKDTLGWRLLSQCGRIKSGLLLPVWRLLGKLVRNDSNRAHEGKVEGASRARIGRRVPAGKGA